MVPMAIAQFFVCFDSYFGAIGNRANAIGRYGLFSIFYVGRICIIGFMEGVF